MDSDRSIEAAVPYGPQSVGCDFIVSIHLLFLDSWYAYIYSDCREKDLHERFIALNRCHPPFLLLLRRVIPARPPHIIKNTTPYRYLNQHPNANPKYSIRAMTYNPMTILVSFPNIGRWKRNFPFIPHLSCSRSSKLHWMHLPPQLPGADVLIDPNPSDVAMVQLR